MTTPRRGDQRTAAPDGLTSAAVEERRSAGRVNTAPPPSTRSISEILRANVLTKVNIIMGSLLVLILIAGKPGDALFAGVIISNSVIGVVQEVRAKRTLDRLEVLNTPLVRVRRAGVTVAVAAAEVVADDIIEVGPGDQVPVDGTVVVAVGLELDESLLTGESDTVAKAAGDEVLSGSFVSSGTGYFIATKIGADSYANALADEARRFVLVNSELNSGISLILRWLTFIIPPVSAVLLWRLLDAEDTWQAALQGMVAAAVAMVPDGLVLLTSITFIVGILALARKQALAKELASVELLARVDVLCLDKTGTITTGDIAFGELVLFDPHDTEIALALGAMVAADPNPNPTLAAIGTQFDDPGWDPSAEVPFSSARKWSAAEFGDKGWWILGAPEMVAPGTHVAQIDTFTSRGQRVIMVAHTYSAVPDQLPDDVTPRGLVILEDEIRSDAAEIFQFLREQGIMLRVISGDHPDTVASVATRAGVPNATSGYDARNLPTGNEEMADALEDNVVFGRVTPHQKRSMVNALQSRGHVVAMTGDGVNDVLALKDADMGIAMGSGSAASRAVAQLTLLDNKFATLPVVLAEGRKVINNIERVSTLFVSKATYAVLIAIATGVVGSPFPFLPRHLTLIGTFSIGLPGFFLAIAPNTALARPGFIRRVLRLSVPAGTAAAIAAYTSFEYTRRSTDSTLADARTVATVVLLVVGLGILALAARPLTRARAVLIAAMAASYGCIMWWAPTSDYFELSPPSGADWLVITIASALGLAGVAATGWVNQRGSRPTRKATHV
jgi:cation-transporting P-type ATPase E